jgi:acetylornithine deacetylase
MILAPRPQSLDLFRRLVSVDTTSRNSNLTLIDFVRDHLDRLGIKSDLVFDATGKKANLYATIGPDDRPGIALSGHTDVVPVDGQDWASDPFKLREAEGKLYGRGTCDMKGFIAIVLSYVPELAARRLKTPIHLLFSYDEEVGCIGVRTALEKIKTLPVRPKGCIVGEPTMMKVAIAHKGKTSLRCHVHGLECHSSLAPTGVNAVEYAAEVISYLKRMGRRFAAEGPFDRDYDVPHTTVHTGIVHGGTALNIVPKDCHFDFEFRFLPVQDPEALVGEVKRFAESELQGEMRKIHAESGFSWQMLSAIPGLDTPEDAEITILAKALAQSNDTTKIAFGTEAGLIDEIDIPTIICGPGSIVQAHKPDEFVSLDQIAQCEAFVERLIARVID